MDAVAKPFGSSRSRRRLVGLAALAAVAWLGFDRVLVPPPDPPSLKPRPVGHGGKRSSPLHAVAVEDLEDALADLHRLRPDARLTRAIELVGGGAAVIEPTRDGWTVRHARRAVSSLPDLPDFEDWLAGLDAVARAAGTTPPAEDGGGIERWAEASPPEILAALAREEAADGPAADALGGFLALTLQQVDAMGLGDEIPARAAEALARARLDPSRALDRETALLAKLLGYSEAARRLSRSLPETDAVRAFATHDAAALRGRAASDPLAPTLLLHLLARTGDFAGWSELVRSSFGGRAGSVPVLISGLRLRGLSPEAVFPQLAAHAVLELLLDEVHDAALVAALERYAAAGHEGAMVLAGMAEVLAVRPAALADRFEDSLARRIASVSGDLAGPAVQRAFYESLFFTALETQALRLLDSLRAERAAAAFHAGLAEARAPLGRAFADWYGRLLPDEPATAKARRAAREMDVVGGSRFGIGPRLRSYRALKVTEPTGEPFDRRELRAMIGRADSRPAFVRTLLPPAGRSLHDLDLEERWLTHVVRIAATDSPREVGRLLFLARDRAGIETLLADATLDAAHGRELARRLRAIAGREHRGVADALRRLVARYPADHGLRLDLASALRAQRRFRDARLVLEGWLDLAVPDSGLERATALARLAEIRLAEGEATDALALAERARASGAADPWLVTASVLEAAGRDAEAEPLLRALLERYPGIWEGTARLAELHWRSGDARRAAEFLAATRNGRHFGAWNRSIAPAFARAFAKRSPDDVAAAVGELEKVGFLDLHLQMAGRELEEAERRELAVRFWETHLAARHLADRRGSGSSARRSG